ncbi:IS110 family transposase [Aphanothece sacrum]|uniref:IS110 family transposase n=2 Tax=Aphanothece sacrum TaxID=1122 RepID=UPI000F60E8A6|nr:transposase [Aphanothece sacrum]
MRVLGMDIGNGTAVCCLLDALPSEPRQFYIDRSLYHHFEANSADVKALLALKPDIAVLEPTGVNYSKIWSTVLIDHGIEVRLIGHNALTTHRDHLGLPDKEDETDAFALAHYGLSNLERPKKFLIIRDKVTQRVRELSLRLEHLNRVQNPIINRMRQDLSWQFPEISSQVVGRRGYTVPIFYRWLAGLRPWKRYDNLYSKTIGLGLTDTVRKHAKRLIDLQSEEIEIEQELTELMQDERFKPYLKVLIKFGFGKRQQAILIGQIYPFENFLDEDNKPIVVFKPATKRSKNKYTKRYLSRRRFEKMLGVAPTESSSGKKQEKKVRFGSDLCRKTLWQWVFTRVETTKGRMNNDVLKELYLWMHDPERKGTPIRLLRLKTASKGVRMLFDHLVLELCT